MAVDQVGQTGRLIYMIVRFKLGKKTGKSDLCKDEEVRSDVGQSWCWVPEGDRKIKSQMGAAQA